ncbi:MAG: lysylphosphatidylglycerol synthase domain-containing protein [Actinomycetota bacterium]
MTANHLARFGGLARALRIGRVVLTVLVVIAVTWAVIRGWDDVRANMAQVSVRAIAFSVALALAALVFTLVGWRAILADLGSPLGMGPASGVLFIGQLGKYVPGTVWTVLAQAEVAAKLGVPRRRTAVAGLLSVLLGAFAGLGVGLFALPALLEAGGSSYWVVLALVPVGVVMLHPRVLNTGVGILLRVLRRDPLGQSLSGRAIWVTMVSFLAGWLCLGGHIWVLAHDLGADAGAVLVPGLFGYALAASVGMAIVFLPAGVGVREGVLVLLLTGPLDQAAALTVAVLSRFLITLCDVLAAGVGWGYDRSHRLLRARR